MSKKAKFYTGYFIYILVATLYLFNTNFNGHYTGLQELILTLLAVGYVIYTFLAALVFTHR